MQSGMPTSWMLIAGAIVVIAVVFIFIFWRGGDK
jgi:uncharacterized membrane protein YqiK